MLSEKIVNHLHMGIFSLLIGLLTSIITYLVGMPALYYLATLFIVMGMLLMFVSLKSDMELASDSPYYAITSIVSLLLLYFVQRIYPLDFSYVIGDGSDYYWAGVSSVLKGDDIGFFLPLTSSIDAIGFKLFGFEYLAFAETILYSSTLPLLYFILRKLQIHQLQAFVFVFLFQMVPLDIWISKSTFSEPVWQVLILLFIYYSMVLTESGRVKFTTLLPYLLLMLLIPMSRGSAVLFYATIGLLSIYSFWRYGQIKTALWIAFGIVLLGISIHYSLGIRARYLLEWQYSRLIPNVTAVKLMSILYGATAFFCFILFLFHSYKKKFRAINFSHLVVPLAILFKVEVALFFAMKKELPWQNLLFMNEFGLLRGNLGMPLALITLFSLALMHIRAFKGDRSSLVLVIFYAIFSIPFAMQNVSVLDQHEMLLYWHRYYFSEFFVIHILSIALAAKLFYDLLSILPFKELTKSIIILLPAVGLFFYSINLTLYNIVTSEGYLSKSSQIFSWLNQRAKGKKVAVVYDSNIHYGVFDANQLLYRGFYVTTAVDVKNYKKVSQKDLNSNIELSAKMLDSDRVLCLSTVRCDIESDRLRLVDTTLVPLWWRRNTDDIYHSTQEQQMLFASLYDVKHSFRVNKKVLFNNSSDLAPKLLGDGWYQLGKDAVWSSKHATLHLPSVVKKDEEYVLEMKFSLYYAIEPHPKRVIIKLNNSILLETQVALSEQKLYSVTIPKELLTKMQGKELKLEIDTPDAVSPYEIGYSKDRRKLGIALYSLELHKSNK